MKNNKYQIINRNEIPPRTSPGKLPNPEIIKIIQSIPDDGRVLVKKCSANKEQRMFVNNIRAYILKHKLGINVMVRGINVYLFKTDEEK